MSKFVKTIVFFITFLLILQNVQFIFQDKSSHTYKGVGLFFQNNLKNDVDVVFIGNSQISSHINPLILFQEQGFVSYALATPGCGGEVMPLYIEEAIKHRPILIVVETLDFADLYRSEASSRRWMDPLPLSIGKATTAWEMLANNKRYEMDAIISG